jgi:predicted Rossmann-fold nucleotide-binding protein
VLFGRDYWSGLTAWLRDRVAGEGKITTTDLDLFQVTDSPAEAVAIISAARDRRDRAFDAPRER